MNRLWVRISLTFVGIIVILICLPLTFGFARQAFITNNGGVSSRIETGSQGGSGLPLVNSEAFEENPGKAIVQTMLRVLFVTSILGSIIGVITARGLTAPLNQLAKAAQDIGAQDLSRRVEVKGSAEIKTVARAFNDMAAALEQAEALRSNLLADVAHELRTPLTVIQGNLRAILDDVYELDKAEIARLYEQTRHLTRLVNDLRELAQAEAHKLPLSLAKVDVAAWVQDTVAAFRPIAEAEGITLNFEIIGEHPHLLADRARLTQSLHNLLYNAVQHTPSGGTVTIQVEQLQDRVYLRVQDTGRGIAPEHLDRVFDRFYRTDRARSRDSGGTGLGLAIVRAIVEAHGGKVTVESQGLGQGSTFTIQLPLVRA
jgi:signal transduction histidine kinase